MSNDSDSIDPESIEIDDPPGRWDNRLVYLIVTAPIAIVSFLIIAGVAAVGLGVIRLRFDIVGQLTVTTIWETVIAPFVTFLIVAAAITWLFALMAWFGASAVIKVGQTIYQMMVDFGGGTE